MSVRNTALTATTLYRRMFGAPIAEGKASFLANEDALISLLTDGTLDVVVVVAGQPAKLLTEMKPEVRKFIKLLRFDPKHPASGAALETYFPATVRAASYPNLLTEDVAGNTSKKLRGYVVEGQGSPSPFFGRFARYDLFKTNGVNPGQGARFVFAPVMGEDVRLRHETFLTSIDSLWTSEPTYVGSGFIIGRMLWGGENSETDIGLPIGPVPICPPNPCALGADIAIAGSSTTFQFTLPCDPLILGGQIAVQGADLEIVAGSCPVGEPFRVSFTNTIVTLIL